MFAFSNNIFLFICQSTLFFGNPKTVTKLFFKSGCHCGVAEIFFSSYWGLTDFSLGTTALADWPMYLWYTELSRYLYICVICICLLQYVLIILIGRDQFFSLLLVWRELTLLTFILFICL